MELDPKLEGLRDSKGAAGNSGQVAGARTVADRIRRALVQAVFGALLGLVPFLVSMALAPTHRSPYLLAYPAVILSAWVWGLPGAVACATVAGSVIEHYIFGTRQINLAPTSSGWMAREFMFLAGSLLVGYLTRKAAQQRQAALRDRLALLETEKVAVEARHRAAELRVALLEAERLAIAGRLSASIAHEVNNPLEAAMNLLYLMRDGVKDAEYQEYLREATEQLRRVAEITQETLRFSRPSTVTRKVLPSKLIEETQRLVKPKLQLAKIDTTVEVRSETEFDCSAGEIQQVLLNLINNAADAIEGGGRIRIRVARSVDWKTRSRHGVRVTVADTGSGMSDATLLRINDAFFTTKEGVGTGLGMWVVQQILQKCSGALSVSTSENPNHHGTVFSVFFPVGEASVCGEQIQDMGTTAQTP